MRIGVSGHQDREGIDWEWTGEALKKALTDFCTSLEGWSSLAVGADQLFARTVLDLGGHIVTVVPGDWYEDCFDEATLSAYRDLLTRGQSVTLGGLHGEEAFLAAGLKVADSTELLVAIWDGKPAKGKGGTSDVVEHALRSGRRVLRIDPVARRTETLGEGD